MELTNTNRLKDPTCAIFLKSMGIKDIKYEGHKGHEGHHVLYFLNAAGSRISNMTFPCVMKVVKATFTFTFRFTFTERIVVLLNTICIRPWTGYKS